MKIIDELAEKIAEAVAVRVVEEIVQNVPVIAAGVAEAIVPKIPGFPDIDNLAGAVVKRITSELSSRLPFFRS